MAFALFYAFLRFRKGDFFMSRVLTLMKGDIYFFAELLLFYKLIFKFVWSLCVLSEDSCLSSELSACDATSTFLSDGASIFKKHCGYFKPELFLFFNAYIGLTAMPKDICGDGAWLFYEFCSSVSSSSSISILPLPVDLFTSAVSMRTVLKALSAKTSGIEIC